jgi:uncharacterized protein YacL
MIKLVRAVFLLLVTIVSIAYISASSNWTDWILMISGVLISFVIITVDIFYKNKKLTVLSGVLFGLLVGILVSLALGYLLEQVVRILLGVESLPATYKTVMEFARLLMSLIIVYVTVSVILQTKDDFRFVIPYVEFQRATKGPSPIILDTSVIIDGRIADMAATGMFETPLVVPRFVLNELQTIADSGDRLKRSRGRRGLEVLEKLKTLPKIELRFWDGTLNQLNQTVDPGDLAPGVDHKLVVLAQQEHGRIMTNDYNLNKVAGLRGISVININSIAEALKPVVLPGEAMIVRIIKPGENAGQGVGYLVDGTMVVVEGARDKVGQEVEVVVTNMIQNAAGKMIFGRMENAARSAHNEHTNGGHAVTAAPAPKA